MKNNDVLRRRWRTTAEMQVRAQQLRSEQTATERTLWSYLRNRQLDGYKFRRQHPIGRFIVDFCCEERRMVVEIDGPVHDQQVERDQARTEALQEAGYTVIRYTNEQIEQQFDAILADLRRSLRASDCPAASPSPAAAGEGAGGEGLPAASPSPAAAGEGAGG